MSGSEDVLDRGLVPAVPEPLARQPGRSGPKARCTRRAARAPASTSVADYGQLGGTLPGTPTPVNPCGDPGGANPSPRRPRVAPSGRRTCGPAATRSRSTAPSSGSIPTPAPAGPTTPRHRRERRQRPPDHRLRPAQSLPVHDQARHGRGLDRRRRLQHVGGAQPAGRSRRGPAQLRLAVLRGRGGPAGLRRSGLSICNNLTRRRRSRSRTTPTTTAPRSSPVTAAGPAARRSRVWPSCPTTSPYPAADHGALFMTDYTRRCIWEMPAGSNGQPDVSARRLFANLRRPGPARLDGGSVFLAIGPTGDLIYADYDRGEIRRIHYYGANVPPVPSFTATPSFGPAPLQRRLRRQRLHRRRTATRSRTPGTSTATASTTTRPGVTTSRDLHGRRRRRGRPAGVRSAGRHPDDEPDRLGRQRSADA